MDPINDTQSAFEEMRPLPLEKAERIFQPRPVLLEEMARIFQVPLHLVGDVEQGNYALMQQARERFLADLRSVDIDVKSGLD